MLGSGQYGKVFLATEVATFKQTVCKISDLANAVDRPSQSSETSPNITRSNALSVEEKGKLKREMWILSKLDHVSPSFSPSGQLLIIHSRILST